MVNSLAPKADLEGKTKDTFTKLAAVETVKQNYKNNRKFQNISQKNISQKMDSGSSPQKKSCNPYRIAGYHFLTQAEPLSKIDQLEALISIHFEGCDGCFEGRNRENIDRDAGAVHQIDNRRGQSRFQVDFQANRR